MYSRIGKTEVVYTSSILTNVIVEERKEALGSFCWMLPCQIEGYEANA